MTTKEIYADSDAVLADVWGMIEKEVWLRECRPYSDARAVFYREQGRGILLVHFASGFDGSDTAIYPWGNSRLLIPLQHVIGLAGVRP